MRFLLAALAIAAAPAPTPNPSHARLPGPSGDPRTVAAATDPLVGWAERSGVDTAFTVALAAAVGRSPAAREAAAGADETRAAADEARAALRPRLDVELGGQQALSRGFSHDPGNLIERSAPVHRLDASITAEQTLFDFGAGSGRLIAARSRNTAEHARAEASASEVALRAASAWIDVRQAFVERDLAEAAAARDGAILALVRLHVASGFGAPADTARVEGAVADAAARAARAQGAYASTRARYAQAFGAQAPPSLARPMPAALPTLDQALAGTRAGPEARYAAARTEAARRDLDAARADLRPGLVLSIGAYKYSVTDPVQDHDVRARLSLRQRIYGGGAGRARVDEAAARAEAAAFAQDRIVGEAERDCAIAWHDERAQNEAAGRLRDAYLAERRARDAYAEQFRVSRGSLAELLRIEGEFVESALAYLRAVAAADLARWTLLARAGLLLGTIDTQGGAA